MKYFELIQTLINIHFSFSVQKKEITVRFEQPKPSDRISFIIDRLTPESHIPRKTKFAIMMIDTMRNVLHQV